MGGIILPTLYQRQIRIFGESSTCPLTGAFDSVDGATEELIVSLDDAHVSTDEDEFARKGLLVREDGAEAFTHGFLHFVLLFAFFAFGKGYDVFGGGVIAAFVGTHECGGCEDVRVLNSPG